MTTTMKYFAKYIGKCDDRAIRGEFDEDRFSPFSLLAVHGFAIPLSVGEGGFLVDLMSDLSHPSERLLVYRCGSYGEEKYHALVNQQWDEFGVRIPTMADGSYREFAGHFVDVDDRDRLADTLRAHWTLRGGNWLIVDWRTDASTENAACGIIARPYRRLDDLRAAIAPTRRVAVMMFDDNLVDLYANCELSMAVDILRKAAEKNGVRIDESSG